jgi:hypothetical protein
MATCKDAAELKLCLYQCIKSIETIRNLITDSNYDKFDISITQHRDVVPVYEMGKIDATGFKQKSGCELEIKIVDNRKKGQVL